MLEVVELEVVEGEVEEGLLTRASGSEDCLVGASLSWGMWGEVEMCVGELAFLPTCPASGRPALIMEVSSLLQALASSSRGLFREGELV